MEAVLIQQKCEKAGVLPVTMSQAQKTEMVDKARVLLSCASGIKF